MPTQRNLFRCGQAGGPALLALGGGLGIAGMFLPWFVFEYPGIYSDRPSLAYGLTLALTHGWLVLSAVAVVPIVDLLALIAAFRVRKGATAGFNLAIVGATSFLCLLCALALDALIPIMSLSPPYIAPSVGIGQVFSLVSFVAIVSGAVLSRLATTA